MAMAGKHEILLFAELDPRLASNLDQWLAEKGYAVRVVDNIKDILLTLQKEKVNVLVLDACLAAGMGYETISIIKELSRNLPIIVTTEENNPEQESSIRKRGIFYYHVKSFGTDELMLAISSAISRSALLKAEIRTPKRQPLT
jgi:DNA-binding NtrC family response regulator